MAARWIPKFFKPQDIYREVRGVAPDLLVYFDNLGWRSVGSFGHGDIYTFDNDTGPDDANHAVNGVYIYTPPAFNLGGKELPDTQINGLCPNSPKSLRFACPGRYARKSN